MKREIEKSIFWWIINILWWLSCIESTKIENLRRNQDAGDCLSELVSSKSLSDHQFTASSYSQNVNIFHPSKARLLDIHSQTSSVDGNAWCPETAVHNTLSEWIQVDFQRMTVINAFYTMGQGDNFQKYSPEIVIKYQRSDSSSRWHSYTDTLNNTIIPINTDSRTKHRTSIQSIVVRRIRIYPLDTRTGPRLVCLKIAFLGCYFNDEVISYTAPQGDSAVTDNTLINLQDYKYDGKKSNLLENGLGILMDNFLQKQLLEIDNKTNHVLTGWKCSDERLKSPISITFYFEQERIFDEISLYYVTNERYNIKFESSILVSIGYNNDSHRYLHNTTAGVPTSKFIRTVSLDQSRGSICTVNISCEIDTWIVLSEVQIKSTKTSESMDQINKRMLQKNVTVNSEINILTDLKRRDNKWKGRYFPFLMCIVLAVALVLVLLSCVAFLFYKITRLKQYKLGEKHEFVALSRKAANYAPSTVFTIQSKHPSISSAARQQYYTESKPSLSNSHSASQPNEGSYASWTNNNEDRKVPSIDNDEDKCLVEADLSGHTGLSKDYAVYQPGGIYPGMDYIHTSLRPLSSMSSVTNVMEKVPLYVSNLKIVSTFDIPASTPIINYRNCQNVFNYGNLKNYRGICGDVDFRCQSLPVRINQNKPDFDIRILPTTSLASVQPWVRGQFGGIDIVTVTLDSHKPARYFMKKLHNDSPISIKSKFILDLKILSTLNVSSVAQLVALVVDNDVLSSDLEAIIRSAEFCLLIENVEGYNLKAFLQNVNYPNHAQMHKTTTLTQCPMSVSTMLLIISQISNGLKHLEDLDLSHRDVGCRNCIIDSRNQIKLYPGGYLTSLPFEDYWSIEEQNHLINVPLRWLAPESIHKGWYSSKSDVWSFGVTMWEVFTMCSIMPYPSLANEALMELLTNRDHAPRLQCPQNCPKDIYELMLQCWSWDESMRPSFADIGLLLQIKMAPVTKTSQVILPAPPPQSPHSSIIGENHR